MSIITQPSMDEAAIQNLQATIARKLETAAAPDLRPIYKFLRVETTSKATETGMCSIKSFPIILMAKIPFH